MFPIKIKISQQMFKSFVFILKESIFSSDFLLLNIKQHCLLTKFYLSQLNKISNGFNKKIYTITISEDIGNILAIVLPKIVDKFGIYEQTLINQYILNPIYQLNLEFYEQEN